MATLARTDYAAEIVWLGHVPAESGSIRSTQRDALELQFGGVAGEVHEGIQRASCVRVKMLHPEGTRITNTRQLSILSAEELEAIAGGVGLDAMDPRHLGASMVVRGIPDFTHVPPGSRLQMPSGATLTVDLENQPCQYPAREIEADHPGHGKAFLPSARERRGVTAWVERPGLVAIGDAVTLFVPTQRSWTPGNPPDA